MMTAIQIICIIFAVLFLIDALVGKENQRRMVSFTAAMVLILVILAGALGTTKY